MSLMELNQVTLPLCRTGTVGALLSTAWLHADRVESAAVRAIRVQVRYDVFARAGGYETQ